MITPDAMETKYDSGVRSHIGLRPAAARASRGPRARSRVWTACPTSFAVR